MEKMIIKKSVIVSTEKNSVFWRANWVPGNSSVFEINMGNKRKNINTIGPSVIDAQKTKKSLPKNCLIFK